MEEELILSEPAVRLPLDSKLLFYQLFSQQKTNLLLTSGTVALTKCLSLRYYYFDPYVSPVKPVGFELAT